MSNSVFIVSFILMTIVSPIFNAKMVYSITCETAKATVKPCLQGTRKPGDAPSKACCDAIYRINLQAVTKPTRQDLCKCFKAVINTSPYSKLTDLPELCHISMAVPFTPAVDCNGYD